MSHPLIPSFAFFGTSRMSVVVLEELEKEGLLPALVVTQPDTPQGRNLRITPSEVKRWAQERNIPLCDPPKKSSILESCPALTQHPLFVVASFGRILPQSIITLPTHGAINIHPSLLPRLRGASPIQSAILNDEKKTGVSLMVMDEKMDHGPIIAQEKVTIESWPPAPALEEMLARKGAMLLKKTLPAWIQGEIKAVPQDETKATYTKKFTKEDALISRDADPYKNFLKIQAFQSSSLRPFFFIHQHHKPLRVIITKASYQDNQLIIERVIPEGKREIPFELFSKQMKV